MDKRNMFKGRIRKIVMGHNENGQTVVLSDAPATTHVPAGEAGIAVYDIWETFQAPAQIPATEPDPSARPLDFHMPEIGVRVRIADMPPAGDRPSFMHRTETVDAVMILQGEMTMLFDNGQEVVMRAGDTLVQRATNHAWVNRSREHCRMLFIMIGGTLTAELKSILGPGKLEWDGDNHPLYSAKSDS